MSDQVNHLLSENAELKKQAENHRQGVEGLLAQLDAHKQVINEHMNQNVVLRTNIVLFQKQTQKLNAELEALKKEVESLKQQLQDSSCNQAKAEAA